MTQEELTRATGDVVTHISRIGTGSSIPSLHTLVDIINIPGCPADELFCMETGQASPAMDHWLCDFISGCGSIEMKLIADMVVIFKNSM